MRNIIICEVIKLLSNPEIGSIYKIEKTIKCLSIHKIKNTKEFLTIAQKFIRLPSGQLKPLGKKIPLLCWLKHEFLGENNQPINKVYYKTHEDNNSEFMAGCLLQPIEQEENFEIFNSSILKEST